MGGGGWVGGRGVFSYPLVVGVHGDAHDSGAGETPKLWVLELKNREGGRVVLRGAWPVTAVMLLHMHDGRL